MVKRKSAGKKTEKSRYFAKWKKPKAYVGRSIPEVCPDRMMVCLPYHAAPTVSAIGPTSAWVFRGNGIFDPDFTGVGAQPVGYDQWAAIYTRYRVYSSHCEVNVVNPSATEGLQVAVAPATTASVTLSNESFAAKPYVKKAYTGRSTGVDTVTIDNFQSTKKMLGVKDIQYSPEYGAGIASNPSSQWYWQIQIGHQDNANALANTTMRVTIKYFVEFYDRADLELS